MAAELKGWWEATCWAEACQPARPPCLLAKVHKWPGIFASALRVSDLRSDQWWEWRVTLIPVLWTLNQCLSTFILAGGKKANYCFVIWVWLGLLSEYPVKREVGYACFSHCNVTRDVWTSSAIFKRKFQNRFSADKSKHNFSLNRGCFCCIQQRAGVFFIRGSLFELNVKRPRNKPWRAIYSTCNSQFWLAFCWVPLNPNLAARVQFMFFFVFFFPNPCRLFHSKSSKQSSLFLPWCLC